MVVRRMRRMDDGEEEEGEEQEEEEQVEEGVAFKFSLPTLPLLPPPLPPPLPQPLPPHLRPPLPPLPPSLLLPITPPENNACGGGGERTENGFDVCDVFDVDGRDRRLGRCCCSSSCCCSSLLPHHRRKLNLGHIFRQQPNSNPHCFQPERRAVAFVSESSRGPPSAVCRH